MESRAVHELRLSAVNDNFDPRATPISVARKAREARKAEAPHWVPEHNAHLLMLKAVLSVLKLRQLARASIALTHYARANPADIQAQAAMNCADALYRARCERRREQARHPRKKT